MLESAVEAKLKWLEGFGFEVLKFKTPGYSGTKDRLILWPKWSPAPPVMVEIKRPGKSERPLQAHVRDDWRARGCDVRDMCDTIEKVTNLCQFLLYTAVTRWTYDPINFDAKLPEHVNKAYNEVRKWKNMGIVQYDAAKHADCYPAL